MAHNQLKYTTQLSERYEKRSKKQELLTHLLSALFANSMVQYDLKNLKNDSPAQPSGLPEDDRRPFSEVFRPFSGLFQALKPDKVLVEKA